MASDRRKTLVLDFDGVLHAYTSPWTRADEVLDGPVPGAVDALIGYVYAFDVAIVSSRSHEPGGTNAMASALAGWLKDQDYRFEVRLNPLRFEFPGDDGGTVTFPAEKPPAHVTLDDRALTFDGRWPSVEEIQGFVPWNKPEPSPSAGAAAAVRTLQALGYTWTGGAQWKPPLGKMPDWLDVPSRIASDAPRTFADKTGTFQPIDPVADTLARVRAAIPASLLVDTGGDVVEAVASTFREYRKVCAENAELRRSRDSVVEYANSLVRDSWLPHVGTMLRRSSDGKAHRVVGLAVEVLEGDEVVQEIVDPRWFDRPDPGANEPSALAPGDVVEFTREQPVTVLADRGDTMLVEWRCGDRVVRGHVDSKWLRKVREDG